MWVCYFDRDHSSAITAHNENQPEEKWESTSWVVGHYKPDGDFKRWTVFAYKWEAEEKVHYLNGGCTKTCQDWK